MAADNEEKKPAIIYRDISYEKFERWYEKMKEKLNELKEKYEER